MGGKKGVCGASLGRFSIREVGHGLTRAFGAIGVVANGSGCYMVVKNNVNDHF